MKIQDTDPFHSIAWEKKRDTALGMYLMGIITVFSAGLAIGSAIPVQNPWFMGVGFMATYISLHSLIVATRVNP